MILAHLIRQMAVVCGLLLLAMTAAAQTDTQDADLMRIPQPPAQNATPLAPPTRGPGNQRIRLEDALTGWGNQALEVPPPGAQPTWQNRLSFDADVKFMATQAVTVAVSDRLSAYGGDTIPSVTSANLENDLREVYVADEFLPRSYVEIGRVNLKEGLAYGWSPTDFFKPRTAVQISSLDPSIAREDRLGVVMIEAQRLFDSASLSAAFAPRLQGATAIPTSAPASFDPRWGRTNSDNRGLITASWTGSMLNPQLLAFFDRVGPHWGASVSHAFNASTVGYLEWSGTREADLTARAIAFGIDTGAFTEAVAGTAGGSSTKHFANDLAAGTSWTTAFNLTLTLEYHYHQSGLTDAEFERIFSRGLSGPRGASLFWYVQQYAADQQEPFMTRELFLRADWQDVIPSTLNLGGVAFVAQRDGSALAQIYAHYFVSRSWTVSAYLGTTLGSTRSAFGDTPWRVSGIVQLLRYL